MPRCNTPSYIIELPLVVSKQEARELSIRLDMGRQLYNAALGESLRRLDLMRESKEYQKARKLPKGKTGPKAKPEQLKEAEVRKTAFTTVQKRFGYSEPEIQKFASSCQKNSAAIGSHTSGHDKQTTTKRAFDAVDRYATGGKGRPKFCKYREFNSVEGKEDSCIGFRAENMGFIVNWIGLELKVDSKAISKSLWTQDALLQSRTKFSRISRKTRKGKDYWYVQVIKEGVSPLRPKQLFGTEIVGIDLGPSTIAIVSSKAARYENLGGAVVRPAKKLRRIERRMDRSKRKSNPHAFNPNGTYKKGTKITVRTKGYFRLKAQKAEVERCLAAERKRAHGQLANRILREGTDIRLEKLSYRGWQKGRYGKSVTNRAPGMFVAILRRKKKALGEELFEFSTRTTKLSQIDHKTGVCTKKALSERVHVFQDGEIVQRDLYSAHLARFVREDETLDINHVVSTWTGAEPLLRCALFGGNEKVARGVGFPLPHVASAKSVVRADCTSKQSRGMLEVARAVTAIQIAARAAKKAAYLARNMFRKRNMCRIPRLQAREVQDPVPFRRKNKLELLALEHEREQGSDRPRVLRCWQLAPPDLRLRRSFDPHIARNLVLRAEETRKLCR
jgi:hypothetical protein